ncbi:MAG: ATP-binding protein [Verrucomicrobia bacterium]|nr:ATP-binding protein [Verrucomicrobiota bacterium]
MSSKKYIARKLESGLREALGMFPVVALLGPRQSGKSTLARHLVADRDAVYLDLEMPSDLNRLMDAESFLRANQNRLVCLDEVQTKPDLFPLLRGLCDMGRRPGRYLVLGSASPELLRQGSETLAGRMAYLHLTPLLERELHDVDSHRLWTRGGFPDSYLAVSERQSVLWRQHFIRTYLTRDVRAYGFDLSPETMGRLWTMLAHSNGQLLNASRLAEGLGVSPPTVRHYVEFLSATFIVRVLSPWYANVKKRLVKTPKTFLMDTGLLHTLLDIEDRNELFGHPVYGSSWESYVLAQIVGAMNSWSIHFYRTARGNEIDFLLTKGQRMIAVECRASAAPQVPAGFYHALDDLGLKEGIVVSPIPDGNGYRLNERIQVATPCELITMLERAESEKS